ncbi:hypothetical protein DM02DRAFT_234252 [Periconia macrospinosa]|uniref:Uncharacterized protein n=1 Tax=Periconia macrospinosa TaxID=97972 RepID=A0A2V1ECT0_9PLEO|nr:hypothetical protein DM02DRAFT_234252 [Periconia macrospinosa]
MLLWIFPQEKKNAVMYVCMSPRPGHDKVPSVGTSRDSFIYSFIDSFSDSSYFLFLVAFPLFLSCSTARVPLSQKHGPNIQDAHVNTSVLFINHVPFPSPFLSLCSMYICRWIRIVKYIQDYRRYTWMRLRS